MPKTPDSPVGHAFVIIPPLILTFLISFTAYTLLSWPLYYTAFGLLVTYLGSFHLCHFRNSLLAILTFKRVKIQTFL